MGSALNNLSLDGFEVIEHAESPRAFHQREVSADPSPQVWMNTITEPALVLGSTQRNLSIIDETATATAGVDIVRRRSGGGAVLLRPGDVTWFDVIIPAGAPGWSDDVHHPMGWLGRRLATSLREVLGDDAVIDVHESGLISTEYSQLVCFDGWGPGEVLLGGRKLVGISQRRARGVARLQCCWYHRYEPRDLVSLFAAAVRPPVEALQPVATLDVVASRAVVAALIGERCDGIVC